jgi:hypothetical protein
MRSRRARFRIAALTTLAAGLVLMAFGAPQVAVAIQLVVAISCAVLSLLVRDDR